MNISDHMNSYDLNDAEEFEIKENDESTLNPNIYLVKKKYFHTFNIEWRQKQSYY